MESNINRMPVIGEQKNCPAIIGGFMNAARVKSNPPKNHRNKGGVYNLDPETVNSNPFLAKFEPGMTGV